MGNRVLATLVLVCIIAAIVGGFFLGRSSVRFEESVVTKADTTLIEKPQQTVSKTATLTRMDTTFAVPVEKPVVRKDEVEVVKKEETVSKKDTVVIRDTVQVAYTDTSFIEGKLKAWYYFPPINKFKFRWMPYPQKVITVTQIKTVKYKPRWYENKYLWGLAGLCIGIAITR